jgi:hypothetical protein
LPYTPEKGKTLAKLLLKTEAEILLGTLVYRDSSPQQQDSGAV